MSVVTGTKIYQRIAHEFRLPCVVAGFEPVDILNAILYIGRQIDDGRSEVEIAYKRAVSAEGNRKAWNLVKDVFDGGDAQWRGIGTIPASGLFLKEKFRHRDAEIMIPVDVGPPANTKAASADPS